MTQISASGSPQVPIGSPAQTSAKIPPASKPLSPAPQPPPADQVTVVDYAQASAQKSLDFLETEPQAPPPASPPPGAEAPSENKALPLFSVLGGTWLANQGKRYMTGRVNLYHGTTATVAKQIRANGLLPAQEAGSFGIIEAKGLPSSWAEKAYLVHSKFKSGVYGLQAWGLRSGEGLPRIVTASIPEWGPRQLALEANPETVGGFSAWKERTLGMLEKQQTDLLAAGKPKAAQAVARDIKMVKAAGWNMYLNQWYGGERAVSAVPSEYIKGSANFNRLSFSEVATYASKYPMRFSAGTAALATGLALAGWGAYEMFKGPETPPQAAPPAQQP